MTKKDSHRKTKKIGRQSNRMISPWVTFVEKCMERDNVKREEVIGEDKYRREYYLQR
jgi:hypothetical protein